VRSVVFKAGCYGLQKLLDICSAYGEEWDIKFNPEKSCVGPIGGNHPSAKVELVAKSLQWRDQVKYLGCMLRCKSCDIDTSGFVSKFYGAFNSIMHVLGYKRNEMVAVQLVGSYCLP